MIKQPSARIQIYNQQTKVELGVSKKEIVSVIEYSLGQLRQKFRLPTRQGQFHFTIIFIDDEKIRDLNQRYRKVNLATDILVFPYSPSEAEIYISLERAYAQAKEYRQTDQKEVLRLIIHGVLHSSGWRDENPKERKKMWTMQEKILKDFLSFRQIAKK